MGFFFWFFLFVLWLVELFVLCGFGLFLFLWLGRFWVCLFGVDLLFPFSFCGFGVCGGVV